MHTGLVAPFDPTRSFRDPITESFAELSEISKGKGWGDGIQADSPPSWSSRRPRHRRKRVFTFVVVESLLHASLLSFFAATLVYRGTRAEEAEENQTIGDYDDRQTNEKRRFHRANGKEVRNTGENTSRSPITFRKNRPVGKTKEKTPGVSNNI